MTNEMKRLKIHAILWKQAGADVNLLNNVGDTPLHKAAFTGRKVPPPRRMRFAQAIHYSTGQIIQEVVMLLLRYNASATVINGTAQIPKDVTQNAEIRSMLAGETETTTSLRAAQRDSTVARDRAGGGVGRLVFMRGQPSATSFGPISI